MVILRVATAIVNDATKMRLEHLSMPSGKVHIDA
jgi:hypothetical protein